MTLQGQCPLTIHTRTFETIFMTFVTEQDAVDVFESVKELTVASKCNTLSVLCKTSDSPCCASASVSQLYAFFYVPNPPFPASNGWSIYSPREEFLRMGVGTRSKAWRFTDINKDYSVRLYRTAHRMTRLTVPIHLVLPDLPRTPRGTNPH